MSNSVAQRMTYSFPNSRRLEFWGSNRQYRSTKYFARVAAYMKKLDTHK